MSEPDGSGVLEGKLYTVVLTVTFFLSIKTTTAATTMTATNTMIIMSRTLEAVRKGEGAGDEEGGWVEVGDGGGSAGSVLTT